MFKKKKSTSANGSPEISVADLGAWVPISAIGRIYHIIKMIPKMEFWRKLEAVVGQNIFGQNKCSVINIFGLIKVWV